jgi:2-oxoisovalerate dehydrogenase E1 component
MTVSAPWWAASPHPTRAGDPQEPVREGTRLTGAQAVELFEAQLTSRHLDLAARWLRSFGEGFYTIGSAGHEGNAAVAAAVRASDPALLHYRSGGFYCARAGQAGAGEPIRDVLRGLVAAATEPIAGGRHKVFGHPDLAVIPTTSTIASHLPRAVGLAPPSSTPGPGRSPGRRRAKAPERAWPETRSSSARSATPRCNHAVAQAAFNTAGWFDHSGTRLPLLFVCEDNGIGISVRSPEGWVAATLRARAGAALLTADGCDLAGRLRRRRRGGRLGPPGAPSGRAAPGPHPADGSRRGRRRGGLPRRRRDRGRPRPGPAGGAPRPCWCGPG